MVNFNVFTWRHKVEYFRQAFISSAGVDRVITGNVCLKSPTSNINAFPNGLMFPRKSCNDRSRALSDFWWAIVHSSQIICLHFCNTFPIPDALEMLHVGVSINFMFNANFKAEVAVLPPESNVADFPDDARAKVMPF